MHSCLDLEPSVTYQDLQLVTMQLPCHAMHVHMPLLPMQLMAISHEQVTFG